jgi:hypothetical protein
MRPVWGAGGRIAPRGAAREVVRGDGAETEGHDRTELAIRTDRDRTQGAIDETHFSRMTLGDRRLEREVLEIFLRQNVIMLERIAGAEPAVAAAAAHTLLGSARGIGAWRVARAAERLEHAAGSGKRS